MIRARVAQTHHLFCLAPRGLVGKGASGMGTFAKGPQAAKTLPARGWDLSAHSPAHRT